MRILKITNFRTFYETVKIEYLWYSVDLEKTERSDIPKYSINIRFAIFNSPIKQDLHFVTTGSSGLG